MLANFEQRSYKDYGRVWVGRYRNLHNLAHWHLEHEIIYIEKGHVTVSHNDKEYLLQQGNLIYINSSQIHYITSNGDSIVSIIMFDSSFLPERMRTLGVQNAVLQQAYSFQTTFACIQQEQEEKRPFYVEAIHHHMERLLLEIYRGEELIQEGDTNQNENLPEYKKLLYEIQKQYADITFTQAANRMGLSESYFSRYFHRMSGMTFSRYLNIIRIEKAIELLKEDMLSVTEISMRCGFDTIRHFNRVFKDITGMSPRQLPKEFVLYHHTTRMLHDSFDPTLEESILL